MVLRFRLFNSAWWSAAPLAYGALLAVFGASVALPSRCAMQWILGVDCPACGLSTALMHLVAGDVAAAASTNLAVIPLAALLTVSMARGAIDHRKLDTALRWTTRILPVTFAVQFLMQFSPQRIFSLGG